MPLIAIYNPVCGDRSAKDLFDTHVVPLLDQHNKSIDTLVATEHVGHAGELLFNFISTVRGEITVILGSGDGTLHDIINYLSSSAITPIPRLNFVLVPCGTANALYVSLFPPAAEQDSIAYKLQSLQSYINSSHMIPLTFAIATLSSPPQEKKCPCVVVSFVVVSTALHASILHDSEALREDMPGIERFKVAAQRNMTTWYNSYVKLLPTPGPGRIQIYDPTTKTFVDHPESDEVDPIVHVDGPFVYFLSTINVDRLESAFRITPLARSIPTAEATCELVFVRPLRDPSISVDSTESRMIFMSKLWAVMSTVYQDGAHIDLRYSSEGKITSSGDGPVVVEYIRCGGWEWSPDDSDDNAHLLCSDGAISRIDKGGRAVCSVAAPHVGAEFTLYA
ncbi:hypothetical protein J132_00556 [Termitomyces sp. J132]|nr:hypothetical protein H2248_009756 [Termitomyces sp. 'cryptogamus']KNZ81448.1 hypothetical protein J132_00556 [Termitomyces sp. J132]